ncbi:hypothetical protein ACFLV4_01850 [Chloroflexota bacterium]
MMRNKIETVPREPEAQDKCRHYWRIDSPNGPTSRGACKFCGEEREFSNSPPEFMLSKRQAGNSKLPDSVESEINVEEKAPDDAS